MFAEHLCKKVADRISFRCPPSTAACSALLCHPTFFWWIKRPKLIREVGWVSYFAFVLVYFTLRSYLDVFLSSRIPPCPPHVCRWISIGGSTWCAFFLQAAASPTGIRAPAIAVASAPQFLAVPREWCFLPCLSPWGGAHKVRHPPCRSCASQSYSQRVGNAIPRVEMGSSLFHPHAQGAECARKCKWNTVTQIWASEPHVPVNVLGWGGMFKAAEISICKMSSPFSPFLTMHLFLYSCSFS